MNKTVEALQAAFEADPNAIHSLIVNRVPCNKKLADDPFVRVEYTTVLEGEHFQVGALGLINGVLAANDLPLVKLQFGPKDKDETSKILGFCEDDSILVATLGFVDEQYVHENLICEFEHYIICQIGLINYNNERYFCRLMKKEDPGDPNEKEEYFVCPVKWTEECEEYLRDYRKAFPYMFYNNGKPLSSNSDNTQWFYDKWGKRNPIEEAT